MNVPAIITFVILMHIATTQMAALYAFVRQDLLEMGNNVKIRR